MSLFGESKKCHLCGERYRESTYETAAPESGMSPNVYTSSNLSWCSKCNRRCCDSYMKDGLCVSHGGRVGCYPDWKLRIETQEKARKEAEEADRERKRAAQEQELRREQERQKLVWENAFDLMMVSYRNKFHCHVFLCSTVAAPGIRGNNPQNMNWDAPPAGLGYCKKCRKLTCREHLFMGVCRDCA
jgi:hypothetical protein